MRTLLAMAAGAALAVTVMGCAGPESRGADVRPDPSVANPPPGPQLTPHTPKLDGFRGSVTETMDAAGYTYVCVDTGDERLWAAVPECKVTVGTKVTVPAGLLMVDFYSKSLRRKFDVIYFVGGVELPPEASPDEGGAGRTKAAEAPSIDFKGLQKPDGGSTIAEILASKKDLAGKKVSLRAKVVKFTPKVLGTNWLHLRDGTGVEGANDLTVTCKTKAKIGDTVLVTGVLALDKDFGFGYQYAVIVEDATVVVE